MPYYNKMMTMMMMMMMSKNIFVTHVHIDDNRAPASCLRLLTHYNMFCFYIHCTALFYAIWPYGHKDEIKVYLLTYLLTLLTY